LPLARLATVPTPLTGGPAIPQCQVGSHCRSAGTPANSTTLRHFSVSSATSLPNSARGAIGLAIPPISVSRAAHLGSFSASPTTWLRTATISGGSALGHGYAVEPGRFESRHGFGKICRTENEARADVFDDIERFYNAIRRPSTIGHLNPVEFGRKVGLA
jgi:hypothetical protein